MIAGGSGMSYTRANIELSFKEDRADAGHKT